MQKMLKSKEIMDKQRYYHTFDSPGDGISWKVIWQEVSNILNHCDYLFIFSYSRMLSYLHNNSMKKYVCNNTCNTQYNKIEKA